MKKPEYLTGEAKTFLEWCEWLHSDPCTQVKEKLLQHELTYFHVQKFYSQPFTKDMIVRPEKPNKKTNNLNAEIVVWEGWQPLFKGEWEFHGNSQGVLIFNKSDYSWSLWGRIDTIDDFIREAKKAGINLEWC